MNISHAKARNDSMLNGDDDCRTADGTPTSRNWCAEVKHLRFPGKLHCILENAGKRGYDDIISWSPCGTKFRIHNKANFEATIMVKYFPAMSTYKSFRRQLNLYDIRLDVKSNIESEYYSHPLLIRGRLCLTKCITRRKDSSSKEEVRNSKEEPEIGAEKVTPANCQEFSCRDSSRSYSQQDEQKVDPNPLSRAVLENWQGRKEAFICKDSAPLLEANNTCTEKVPPAPSLIELDGWTDRRGLNRGITGVIPPTASSSAPIVPNFAVENEMLESAAGRREVDGGRHDISMRPWSRSDSNPDETTIAPSFLVDPNFQQRTIEVPSALHNDVLSRTRGIQHSRSKKEVASRGGSNAFFDDIEDEIIATFTGSSS